MADGVATDVEAHRQRAAESWARRAFYDGEYWPVSRRVERIARERQNEAALIAWAVDYRRSHA
jgi:hypothetical protein